MRKTITIGIFLFFTASISFSQKLSFGALVGLDLSKIQVVDTKKYTEDRNIYSPLWSCNANGYLSLKGKSFFGATIELGFIRKGGIRKNLSLRSEQIIFQPQTVSFYSNYIQVPIYADFYLLKKLTFSTGVDFDFLINSKVKSKLITFESSKEYDKIEISGNVKITFNLFIDSSNF